MLVEANAFFGKTRTAATTYGLVIPEDSPNTSPDGDFEIDGFMNLGKSELNNPYSHPSIGMAMMMMDYWLIFDVFAQRTTLATRLSILPKSATSPRRRTSTSLRICMSCRSLFLLGLVLVRFEEEEEKRVRSLNEMRWTRREHVYVCCRLQKSRRHGWNMGRSF
jgi:hypothetical protein